MGAQESAAALLQQAGLYDAQQLRDYTDRRRQTIAELQRAGILPPPDREAAEQLLNEQVERICTDCGTALEDGRCFPCREQATIKRAHMAGEGWDDRHCDIIAGMRAWQPVGR